MDLNTYFERPDALSASKLAEAIGVSKGRISQLRGGEPWSPELALAAEKATGGLLDASKLNPVIAQARATGEAA